jgi:outer membrane protein TolC
MFTVAQATDTVDGETFSSSADRLMSPALVAFVRTVLEDNPGLLAARSTVDAAQARARAAGQPLYNP